RGYVVRSPGIRTTRYAATYWSGPALASPIRGRNTPPGRANCGNTVRFSRSRSGFCFEKLQGFVMRGSKRNMNIYQHKPSLDGGKHDAKGGRDRPAGLGAGRRVQRVGANEARDKEAADRLRHRAGDQEAGGDAR